MKLTLLALGSRGDVQPLLALAVELAQRGRHPVRFRRSKGNASARY